MTPLEFVQPIALRLIGSSFQPSELADVMVHDGGLDMEPFDKEALLKLMQGQFDCDWDKVFFSLSELLSYYANLDLTNYQIVSWCITVLIIGEGSRRDSTNWELYLHAVTRAFQRVSQSLTYEEFVAVLETAFDQRRDSI